MKAVSLLLALAVCASAAAQEAQIKAAHFIASPTSGFRSVFNTWMERVNAEGKGLVRIVSVVSEESIPGMQMPTALRNGLVEMIAVPPPVIVWLGTDPGPATSNSQSSPSPTRSTLVIRISPTGSL